MESSSIDNNNNQNESLSVTKWAEKRRDQMRKANERISKKNLAIALIVGLLITRGLFRIPLSRITKVSLTSLLIAAIASLKPAPALINKQPAGWYHHYPIIGGAGWLFKALTSCPVQQQIEEAKATNFKATEICLLGGTRDMAIYDKRDIEHMLKDNWKNYTKNCEGALGFLDFFGEFMGRGIFTVDWDDNEWQAHRKTASFMFSNTALTNKMEISFNKHGRMLVNLLQAKAQSATVFNIQDAMQALTFDAIFDIAFGVDSGALEASLVQNKRIDFLVRFDRLQQNLTNRFLMPAPVWQLLRKLNLFYEALVEEDAREVRAYVSRIVEVRKNDPTSGDKGDLLSLYIDTANRHADKVHLKDKDYLSDMVLNFAVAGRDTTSCTLTNLLLELANDEILAKRAFYL